MRLTHFLAPAVVTIACFSVAAGVALLSQTQPPPTLLPRPDAMFTDLRASWIDTQLRIAQRAAQISDLQRQIATLQAQAATARAAMQRDCEARKGTLTDVQMPDGAQGETRPECKLPEAPKPPK
jgi:hypothetical protein